MKKLNFDFSGMSGIQIQVFQNFKPDELQSYINQINAVKFASNGIFNEDAIKNYSVAIEGLEAKQAALLLSTQSLTNVQIAETISVNEVTAAETYQAMADTGLLKSKQKLTVAKIQKNLQTVLGEDADTSAAMVSLGLSVAIERQEHQLVQLTAKNEYFCGSGQDIHRSRPSRCSPTKPSN